MTNYNITGNGYSEHISGNENFKKAAKKILVELKIDSADIFGLKTVEDFIDVLTEQGLMVQRTTEDIEDKIPVSAQITKIKIGKDERNATIMYTKNGSKASKEVTYKGYEAAVDKFICDFREMSKHIIETLSFPEEWLDRMTTTGLSITWKEDSIMGMVITAQLEIDGLNAPFNLNTPFIELYSWHIAQDNTSNICFGRECEELLEKVIADAKRYMNGENADPVQQKIEGLN